MDPDKGNRPTYVTFIAVITIIVTHDAHHGERDPQGLRCPVATPPMGPLPTAPQEAALLGL